MASKCPITQSELDSLKEFHQAWILKPITFNMKAKVQSLGFARHVMKQMKGKQSDQALVAAFSYLNQYVTPDGKLKAGEELAAASQLRQVCRLLFPEPADFGDFMKMSVTFMTAPGVPLRDETVHFGFISVIYLSAFAETWNVTSRERIHRPETAPTWRQLAIDMNTPAVFGSDATPRISLALKAKEDPKVDLCLKWVGSAIDMAVELETWEGDFNETYFRQFCQFMGMK